MKIFAIICLAVILIVLQHLMNWGYRKWFGKDAGDYDNPGFAGLLILIIGLLASYGILITLARWIVEVQYNITLP